MTLYHKQRQLCTIMGKFKELYSIILGLRMNLSFNNTNMYKTWLFWVEICRKLPNTVEL